jgi:hypothetical protein
VRACRVHDLSDGTPTAFKRAIHLPIRSSATPMRLFSQQAAPSLACK